jgi:pimeloyl-ACP methyl ester carboxylesterase
VLVKVPVPGGAVVATVRGDVDGSGRTLVLHPSLGRPASDFDDLAARLAAAGHRVVTLDPRGIGASTGDLAGLTLDDCAGDVARVVERLDPVPTKVTVIGHAFGNRVVRRLSAMRPDLVEAVVLLGAGGRVEGDAEARAALVRCFSADRTLDDVATAFFAPGNDASVWAGGWHDAVAAAQAGATRAAVLEDWWDAGTAPMLVVQGLDDRAAPPGNGRALRDGRAHVTLVELAHAGHALLPEQPDAVAEAVLAFLR